MRGTFISTVGAALGAVRFWILHLPTLLRLTWFPLAVAGLASYGWAYWNYQAGLSRVAHQGVSQIPDLPYPSSFEGVVVWMLLHVIALSSSATAVHRYVVHGEACAGEWFRFSFGRGELAYALMCATAYVLMCLLWLGQYIAQLDWPVVDASLVDGIMATYTSLGPWALSMYMFPGELPMLAQPFDKYLLWVLLVTTAFAVIIRLSPWPSIAASEGRYALADSFGVTAGQPGSVLVYWLTLALCLGVLVSILSIAGLGGLALNPDGLHQWLASMEGQAGHVTGNWEVDSLVSDLNQAGALGLSLFISGVIGVSLGAVLVSQLHLHLKRLQG